MTKKIGKASILIVMITIIMFAIFVMTGCLFQGQYLINLAQAVEVDRIIYTNDANKYIEGKRIMRDEEDDDTVYIGMSTNDVALAGMYFVYNDDYTMDIVIDTTRLGGGGSYFPITPMLAIYYVQEAWFDNCFADSANNGSVLFPTHSYLFSDNLAPVVMTESKAYCSDPECTCGVTSYSDPTYYSCYCQMGSNYSGTYDELPSDLCPVCYSVTQTYLTSDYEIRQYSSYYYDSVNAQEIVGETWTLDTRTGDYSERIKVNDTTGMRYLRETYEVIESGEYQKEQYEISQNCPCKVLFEYSNATIINSFPSETMGLAPITYNELVIDGFDFSFIDNLFRNQINLTKQSGAYDQFNYDQYLDFNNYSHMFDSLPCKKISLNNITGITYDVEDLSYMFANCKNLESVDFGNFFDNIKPKDISYMFYNCPNLVYADLSSLDTSNVENAENMFNTNRKIYSTREDYLDEFVNTKAIPMLKMSTDVAFEETNNGKPWTFEEFCLYFIQLDEDLKQAYAIEPEKTMQMVRMNIMMIGEGMLLIDPVVPISFDEYAGMYTDFEYITFEEFYKAVNNDPSILSLPAKDNGELYTEEEIKMQLLSKDNVLNIDPLYLEVTSKEKIDNMMAYYNGQEVFNSQEEEINYILKYSEKALLALAKYEEVSISINEKDWTLRDLTEKLIQDVENINLIYQENPDQAKKYVEALIRLLVASAGYNYPVAYEDFALYKTQGKISNMEEFLLLVNEDPEAYDFEATTNGYTMEDLRIQIGAQLQGTVTFKSADDIKKYYEDMVSLGAREYEIDGYEFEEQEIVRDSRDEILDDYAKQMFIYSYIDPEDYDKLTEEQKQQLEYSLNLQVINFDTLVYTSVSDLAAYVKDPIGVYNLTKKQLIYKLAAEGAPGIYVTWDELLTALFQENTTLDEFVTLFNTDPTQFGFEAKEDGTPYTVDEIKEMIRNSISSESQVEIDIRDEIESYIVKEKVKVYKGTQKINGSILILGGVGSKFKITKKMNTTDMLLNSTFVSIVTPEIEEGVNVKLGAVYVGDNGDLNDLGNDSQNQLILLKGEEDVENPDVIPELPTEEPEQPEEKPEPPVIVPEDTNPISTTWIIILSIIGGLIAVALVVIVVLAIASKKKKNKF